jgi:hypothetical protein
LDNFDDEWGSNRPVDDSGDSSRMAVTLHQKLTQHGLDSSRIKVLIDDDGEITLAGQVFSRAQRNQAEDIAGKLVGAENVHNQLRVADEGYNPYGDRDFGRWGSQSPESHQTEEEEPISLHAGMPVVDNQGKMVGTLKEARADDILVNRKLAWDLAIPHHSYRQRGDQIELDIPAEKIDEQDWKYS